MSQFFVFLVVSIIILRSHKWRGKERERKLNAIESENCSNWHTILGTLLFLSVENEAKERRCLNFVIIWIKLHNSHGFRIYEIWTAVGRSMSNHLKAKLCLMNHDIILRVCFSIYYTTFYLNCFFFLALTWWFFFFHFSFFDAKILLNSLKFQSHFERERKRDRERQKWVLLFVDFVMWSHLLKSTRNNLHHTEPKIVYSDVWIEQ